MKRTLFIGSSNEGLKEAEAIKTIIENQCNDWIEANLWNEGDIFTVNSGTLDSLIKASMQYDYAILVATNDDIIKSRGEHSPAARDNVIFEAGLFIGALAKNRTFIVADKAINLPSDFNGTTVCLFSQNEKDDLVNTCNNIITELNKTRHSYQLRHLPSAALAMGYFDNYIVHFFEKRKTSKLKVIIPKSFDNIEHEISNYKSKHKSKKGWRLPFNPSRTMGYKYKKGNNTFWDIPTTLQTIRKLVDKIIPQTEIGKNPECDHWLEKEVHNFGHTLEELIKQDKTFINKVEVEFI